MYGSSVLTDEVLRTVEKELTNYMVTEKLDIFAQTPSVAGKRRTQINIETLRIMFLLLRSDLKPGFELLI
jgi:trigger factor